MNSCKKWLDTCVFFLKRWQSVTDPNLCELVFETQVRLNIVRSKASNCPWGVCTGQECLAKNDCKIQVQCFYLAIMYLLGLCMLHLNSLLLGKRSCISDRSHFHTNLELYPFRYQRVQPLQGPPRQLQLKPRILYSLQSPSKHLISQQLTYCFLFPFRFRYSLFAHLTYLLYCPLPGQQYHILLYISINRGFFLLE